MAMESNTSSVLAKLMGFKKLSHPHTALGRRRVLSENYLQKIASVAQRERSLPSFINDFSMDVGEHQECEDGLQFAEGTSVDEQQDWLHGNSNAGVNTNGSNLSKKHKSDEIRFLPQEPGVQQGFDLKGCTSSCSPLGQSTVQGLSRSSVIENHNSSKRLVLGPKSCPGVTGSYMHHCSSSKRMMEMNLENRKSYTAGTSFTSPNYLSDGRKEEVPLCARNKVIGIQGRKAKSSYNALDSTALASMSSKEIAKQVTSQVQHSVWHSCLDVPKSGPRSDIKSYTNDYEGNWLSLCLPDSENKCEASSSNPIRTSNSRGTQKMKKWQLESWRARKCTLESRFCLGRKLQDHVNCSQAAASRYLSKPLLFPSAWVPRNKARYFTLDKKWCLRPGEMDGKLHNDSVVDNVGHQDVGSIFEPSGPRLDLEKHYTYEEASSVSNDSAKLDDQKILEDLFTVCESFSDMSGFSDVESLSSYKSCMILNESGADHLRRGVSQDSSSVTLSSICYSAPSSENVTLQGNGNSDMSTELQWEQLPAKSNTNILLHEATPNFQDFIWKHELQNSGFQPGSPVSSLEGPEACRPYLNLTVEPNEMLSAPGSLQNVVHGLQMKLHLLEAVSLESGSDGPGMMISNDEGDEGGSLGCYRADAQIIECTLEILEFSYLVDVLVESGILMGDLEMDCITWYCRGFVLDPLVFDLLEKKYGKSTVRERSERRLLFDRINSGLMEIFRPDVGIYTWRKPVAKRFGSGLCQELIEEELWALLGSQEEELRRESSNTVCRSEIEWLNLEEDVDLIAQDVQTLLIDELIEEYVSMVISFS